MVGAACCGLTHKSIAPEYLEARNLPFRNVFGVLRATGRRFGESELLSARRTCRGKNAYRGFIEVPCVRRAHRQFRAVEAVAEAGAFPDAREMGLYYADQYFGWKAPPIEWKW